MELNVYIVSVQYDNGEYHEYTEVQPTRLMAVKAVQESYMLQGYRPYTIWATRVAVQQVPDPKPIDKSPSLSKRVCRFLRNMKDNYFG